MGQLASHNVGVFGEGNVSRYGDLDIVGYSGVVIAVRLSVCGFSITQTGSLTS